MAKVLVVGVGSVGLAGSVAAIEKIKNSTHEQVEVVVIEKEQQPFMQENKVIELKPMPLLDMPIILKKKHQHRGHERPYKYHR